MAITAAGLFGLTLEKYLITTGPVSMEAETMKEFLITDSATPNFDTHDFRNDLDANEVSGPGYTAGGVAVGTTEITLSGGTLTFDAADTVYTTVTISNAMAGVLTEGNATNTIDDLILLQDFVTAASATAANFTIQHAAGGIMTWDYTP